MGPVGAIAKFGTELRWAARHLARSRSFAVIGVVTLAVGVGITAGMFALMDALLFRPPAHVADAENVRRLRFHVGSGADAAVVERTHYPTFADLKASGAFHTLAAYAIQSVSVGQGSDAVLANAILASGQFFEVLRPPPLLGSLSLGGTPPDESGTLVVVSQRLWQRHFAGVSAVIGAKLTIDGEVYTVAGVVPEGFQVLSARPVDVWLPLQHATSGPLSPKNWRTERGSFWLSIVGRLASGGSEEIARERAGARLRNRPRESDDNSPTEISMTSIVPGRGADSSLESRVSLWLSGVSCLVLLIACANVSNLALTRALALRRDSFIRFSLGAGRADLVRRGLAETSTLILPGLVGGLWVSFVIRNAISSLLSENIPLSRSLWDARAAGILLGSGAVAFLLVWAVSFWHMSAAHMRGAPLAEAARSDVGKNVRFTLLAFQAGLCLVLLFLAGLFATSLARVESLDLGIDLGRTIQVTINLPPRRHTPDEARDIYRRAVDALAAHPDVERVVVADGSPYMSGTGVGPRPSNRGFEELWRNRDEVAYRSAVGPGFFSAVGAQSLRGRDFDRSDVIGAQPVAIVNAPLARYLWPARDPLGECMWLDRKSDCVRIVGVLDGVWKFSVFDRDRMAVYLPLTQSPGAVPGALFIRPRGDPQRVLSRVRSLVQMLQPDLPAVRLSLASDIVAPQFRPWRLGATVFSVFASVALVIAAAGLYSIVAVTTALRFKEIGIRMALGARRWHVIALVVTDGMRAVATGLFVGGLVISLAAHRLSAVLFQTSPADSSVLARTTLLLFAASIVAIIVPCVRAVRTNPARVLQSP